ncbi:MAG: DUF2537 domain-containing protein [Labedaea sp.]
MTVKGAMLELRAVDGRPVLVGGTDEREVDPGNLALDRSLSEALQEWAAVASAVRRSTDAGPAVAVVSRRGRQLAAQLAEFMGVPVSYADPLTGEVVVLEPAEPGGGVGEAAAGPTEPAALAEPVPWLSGLTVSAFIFVLVFVAVLTLAVTLAATNPLLAVASNVVVTAGLLPSVWLVRQTPIWRWIALGVAAAIAGGWLALPLILL